MQRSRVIGQSPRSGRAGAGLVHVLRVNLAASRMVRNIYSLDFLDPRLVLGDARILRTRGLSGGSKPAAGVGEPALRYAQGISLGMPLRSTAS